MLTDPQALRATADAVAAAADELAAAGDGAGEAKGHSVHAAALARLGKIGACEAALDRALAAARRVDDRRRSNAVLGYRSSPGGRWPRQRPLPRRRARAAHPQGTPVEVVARAVRRCSRRAGARRRGG